MWFLQQEGNPAPGRIIKGKARPSGYSGGPFFINLFPYRERKVRILNGAHTSMVMASYLAGNNTVLESMQDPLIGSFMLHTVFDEIIPTLTLPEQELVSYANSVMERFRNPYIRHSLLLISLKSVSKWKTRCLPSFKDYVRKFEKLPVHLVFSMAAMITFYRNGTRTKQGFFGSRYGEEYQILDESAVLEFFQAASCLQNRELTEAFLSRIDFFGEDLTGYEGLVDTVTRYLDDIGRHGIREAIRRSIP